MKASISEIVGRAADEKGKEVSVYRALRPLLCARCGAEIKEDQLFTRRKLAEIRIAPCCRECVPFELLNNSTPRSPLLDSLLRSEAQVDKARKPIAPTSRVSISKEVERRLGPALARCRTGRR